MRLSSAALRSRGPLACQIALALVVLAVCAVAAVPAWLVAGAWGPAAAGVAAGSCWLGAAAALWSSGLLSRRGNALGGLLVGMGFRMGMPLASVVVFHLVGGVLVEAGLLYYFLVFYPLTLAVETALSLPPTGQQRNCRPDQEPVASKRRSGPAEKGSA